MQMINRIDGIVMAYPTGNHLLSHGVVNPLGRRRPSRAIEQCRFVSAMTSIFAARLGGDLPIVAGDQSNGDIQLDELFGEEKNKRSGASLTFEKSLIRTTRSMGAAPLRSPKLA